MTKSDNREAFSIHYNMMNFSGTWPRKNPSFRYTLKTLLSWALGSILCITMLWETAMDFNNFTKLSEILYIVVTITIYLIKLGTFTYYRQTFMNMIDFLKDPIFFAYPDHLDHYMVKAIKLARFVANFYRSLCVGCMILYTIYPIIDKKPLPFPIPVDIGKYRLPMYIFQLAGVCSCAWNNSCLDTLTTSLMGLATAHLNILMAKITGITDEDKDTDEPNKIRENTIIRQLKQCVEHHLAIIKYIESINIVFAVAFLGQFVASAVVICNTLFHFFLISKTSSQFYLLMNYFTIMFCELYINCWFGNEIMWKSVRVGEACYTSKWYNHSKEVGQYLFIIMERSKRPLTVTAFKLSKLCLASFATIIQWSYSYLALLLKLYHNRKQPSGQTANM